LNLIPWAVFCHSVSIKTEKVSKENGGPAGSMAVAAVPAAERRCRL